MNDFTNLFPGWIGFYAEEMGAVLAARDNGNQLLFASKDRGTPVRWIKTTDFTLHPEVIRTPQELKKPGY